MVLIGPLKLQPARGPELRTVSVAAGGVVGVPLGLFKITVYCPASVELTFAMVKMLEELPEICGPSVRLTPSFCH